ncbi:MAG: DegT/DnrJ/EryC1/StrS family aminotransferase [Betaproteobacteria bacterium]|nr:DegT/DnrJ/EryC1/StrS family aminotransferase [Betaproteobacteria bacterium]
MSVPLNDLKRAALREREALHAALARVADSGWYILGEEVRRFEAGFARYVGVTHAVGVGNGTDAIELALRALGAGPGRDVVTAANAGGYASAAIRRCGARPVYADVSEATMCVDAASVAAALTPATAAVIATHLYGRLADVAGIAALCASHGVPLVEDCAQAHGAARDGRRAGSFGRIGCFSFYPTKNLGALGDAGAVVTDDTGLDASLRALCQYGWRDKYDVRVAGGVNSRLDELQAVVLSLRLAALDERNARRRSIARRYSERIRHAAIAVPDASGDDYVAHLYVVRTPARASLQAHLAHRGIATDVHYPIPDHRQSAYAADRQRALPVTERLAAEVLTLPCFPELSDDEADRVIEACNDWRTGN